MKNIIRNTTYAAILSAGLITSVHSAPVDLSSWTAEGPGNWVLQAGNDSVKQTLNDHPTVFHNNTNSQGLKLSGEITVQTTGDDDYIGFVLGYNAGDLANTSADYLLIDWKQFDQGGSFGGTALKGLSISRVTDTLPNGAGSWLHSSADGVEELQRATNLGSIGWNDNQTYAFDLVFTSSLVEVFVDGTKEISLAGSFNNGSFGFYNYSQANVLYAGIQEDVVPDPNPNPNPIPVPSTLVLLGIGLLGFTRYKKA